MQTQFGEWAVALGIDWTMPSDSKEVRAQKKKQAELAEHAKDAFVLMTSDTGQRWLGFHAPVAGKVYAGALLVAMVKPNAVVYQPLGDGHAWVCAIQDGMPVVRHDKVLPAHEARDTAIAWSSMFPQAEMIGDLQGAQAGLADVLAVLNDGLESKTIKKKELTFALLSTTGLPVGRIALAVGAVVFGAAAAYGVTWFTDVRDAQSKDKLTLEEAARQSMASAEAKAQVEAAKKAAQATMQTQVEAARAAQASRIVPVSFWSAMTAVRGTVPISLRGYKPQTYECVPATCRVSWLGAGRFVRVADKLLLPNVERNLSAELTATSAYPLVTRQGAMPRSRAESGEELRLLLQSALSVHGKNFTADAPQPVSITAPPAAGLQPVVVAEVGKWKLQMQGASAYLDAGALVELMNRLPMRVTSIKYQPVAHSVELEGEFVFMSELKG